MPDFNADDLHLPADNVIVVPISATFWLPDGESVGVPLEAVADWPPDEAALPITWSTSGIMRLDDQ